MDLGQLLPRQDASGSSFGDDTDINTGDSTGDQFLGLIANPFQSQIQSTSFYAALGWSFAGGAVLFVLFCLLRPRVDWIYAPRAKHADAKHAPPATSPGFFGWWPTLKAVKEQDLVEKIGLDAVLFLRFLKMLRNVFIVLSVIGCGVLIPTTLASPALVPSGEDISDIYAFMRLTPQYLGGNVLYVYIALAYVFTGVIFYFLWRNYRAVTRLRRTYFESADYRNSLHSRTLLVTHIPSSSRSEGGMVKIVQQRKVVEDSPNVSIARNVKELPEMVEEHEETVIELEKVLAKYLANPNSLPAQRPQCKPSKHDKARKSAQKVDAIDYLTERIRELEREITETRQTVDQRHPHPYGFASYTHIEDAHAVAYATRTAGPEGTTIKLSPKPHDLIWRNLPMGKAARRTQTGWNSFWMVILTVLYIPPNILTAVFLANLHNLGQIWDTFHDSLQAHPTGWGIAQGIVAPGLQILFYYFLPAIFRRLLIRSGDVTKTQRERHVTSKLYGFFVFNNLFVFSVFASVFAFVATVVNAQQQDVWDSIKQGQLARKVITGFCNISPYWATWQLQRNLGAAVDILQAWPLVKNFTLRKLSNPTPRQLVELTAPQPFEYADYYNNYLFVATVGLAYGTLQPLILPITALYITIDAWFKKYMLQYIFITKVESGGAFWRMLFNRVIFGTLLMNLVITLLVGALGFASPMCYVMIPIFPIMAGFKWYCSRTFDTSYNYYTTKSFGETEMGEATKGMPERKARRGGDRVGVKFGHPALYKRLTTPMVHAKSQHLLKQIYRGRLDSEDEGYDVAHGGKTTGSRPTSVFGYSDIYMNEMSSGKPGKESKNNAPFEVVSESELDFENFKRRSDWRNEYGGDGELYGRPDDHSRPGTPSSRMSFGANSTLMGDGKARSRSQSPAGYLDSATRDTSRTRVGTATQDAGTEYPRGYANLNRHSGPPSRNDSPTGYGRLTPGSREGSPAPSQRMDRLNSIDIPDAGLGRNEIADAGLDAYRDDDTLSTYERRSSQGSMSNMLQSATGMGRSQSPGAASALGEKRISRRPVGAAGSDSRSPPAAARRRQSPGAASGLGRYQYTEQSGGGGGRDGLMGTPPARDEPTSYDYFRRGRLG